MYIFAPNHQCLHAPALDLIYSQGRYAFDKECQVTKPASSLYKAAVYVPDFDTLVPAPELSLPIQFCRYISREIVFWIHERQPWSGSESVEIRYVNGSFVAGTSATLPGVPRHIQTRLELM